MKTKLKNKISFVIAMYFTFCLSYIFSQDCSEGYTFYDTLPTTATILEGNSELMDSCLSAIDLITLDDIITDNSLDYSDPINVGNQTWEDGRLKGLVASYEPNGTSGVNAQLTSIPESIGNLSELAFLYLEWNSLIVLPNSFSQLTNLFSLTINNNWLTSLPGDFGNLNNLLFLDLGYNQINSIPESICELDNLQYLYLFNNQLESVPDCICELNIDWSGWLAGFPYFGIGANQLCDDVPDCIENSENFELTLDQFYYSFPVDAPQNCCPDMGDLNGDGGWNVLDIVALANCVLAVNCTTLGNGCAGDMNGDGGYNVLDIVALANCVLAANCGG